MKNFYFLLLIVAGTSVAQPVIQDPGSFALCDDNSDGIATFNLTQVDSYVLGALDPSTHTVSYYETFEDAQMGLAATQLPDNYTNIGAGQQTIYVRAVENSTPSLYSTTTVDLFVYLQPVLGTPPDMVVYENAPDGVAVFNLDSQFSSITNDQLDLYIVFYETLADAQSQSNPLAFDQTDAYTNVSNPQTIYAVVHNAVTGCFAVTSFGLQVAAEGIVNIPDPIFKANLIAAGASLNVTGAQGQPVVVDVNGDGEVQFSEAQLVYKIQFHSMGINSVEGINSFTNLQWLSLFDNNLSALDLGSLTELEHLNAHKNFITTLDLSNKENLQHVQVTENNLTSLNVANCTALEFISCQQNQLTELNLSGFELLKDVNCAVNDIQVLDISSATELERLSVGGNELTEIDLSAATNLEYLEMNNNNISTLDLSQTGQLRDMELDNNPITSLDLSALPLLEIFSISNSLLTSLDFSNNPNLCNYIYVNGPTITSLNLKNGGDPSCNAWFMIEGLTNLEYVCADEDEVVFFRDYFESVNIDANVNSYCTFTPGGDYNQLSGIVQFDMNGNGCDLSDIAVNDLKVTLSQGADTDVNFTYNGGAYTFYPQSGMYSVMPVLENPTYFTVSPPSASVNFPVVDGSTVTQNFCLSANGVHPDVEVAVIALIPSQPGFNAVYKIVYKNKGNQLLAGQLFFEFDDVHMDFVSSAPTADNMLTGYLGYEYTNLLPFENREIIVTLDINAPTDTPAVNIGDVLTFTANAVNQGADETPADNIFIFDETVVGSYDPNNKLCSEGDVVAPHQIGEYLHYVINFENTGTAPAQNIVVRDSINPLQFDVSSVQIMNSSHPVVARQNGNILECIFEGINLDSGGHGNILLKIKTLTTLAIGDEVSNKADIFFDYNFPIETNNAVSRFEALGVSDHSSDPSIAVYPNPTKNLLTIQSDYMLTSVELFDIQGRLLQSSAPNELSTVIDISQKPVGVYYLRVSSQTGLATLKILKN